MEHVHRIREIAEELILLDQFTKDAGYLNTKIVSNGISLPVPRKLMEKWYVDLQRYREELVKELKNATKE